MMPNQRFKPTDPPPAGPRLKLGVMRYEKKQHIARPHS